MTQPLKSTFNPKNKTKIKNWDLVTSLHSFRISVCDLIYEPPHGKTNNLHMRKQRRRSASRLTAKLISAFVFATRIVQFLFYLNPKFQASSSFLRLYRSVCVGPVRKPHCWFSHEAAQMISRGSLDPWNL